jgi:hypothetical protein
MFMPDSRKREIAWINRWFAVAFGLNMILARKGPGGLRRKTPMSFRFGATTIDNYS